MPRIIWTKVKSFIWENWEFSMKYKMSREWYLSNQLVWFMLYKKIKVKLNIWSISFDVEKPRHIINLRFSFDEIFEIKKAEKSWRLWEERIHLGMAEDKLDLIIKNITWHASKWWIEIADRYPIDWSYLWYAGDKIIKILIYAVL